MKKLICPVSTEKLNNITVRTTGLLVFLFLALFLATGNPAFPAILVLDYLIRSLPGSPHSPLSSLAENINIRTKSPVIPIGKAAKIFAARVGLLFSISILALAFYSLPVAQTMASILLSFVVLEVGFDVCMGCLMYTYLIEPVFNKQNRQ